MYLLHCIFLCIRAVLEPEARAYGAGNLWLSSTHHVRITKLEG